MPKESFPTTGAAFVNWLPRFRESFVKQAATLGFTGEEIAAVGADVDWLEYFSRRTEAARAFLAGWMAARDSLRDGPSTDATPTVLDWAVPEPPAGPVPPPGALGRLRAVVARLKRHPGYDPGLGVTLAVVRNRPAASVQPPQFSLRAQRDDVVVRFRKAGHQGVIIESRRGAETEFARLAVRTFSPFRDQRPVLVPGTPEVRVYRLRFMDHDEPSAACSDLQEILLRGEIIVRERTEAAEAAKGA